MALRIAVFLLSVAWISQTTAFGQTTGPDAPPAALDQTLVRAAAPMAVAENLQQFDEHAIEVRWASGDWQLWAGTVFLKDFGKKEQEARTAMHLIRELHLNARGRLGTPQAVAEYWLSDGQPPQVAPEGARTLAFDPESLSVIESEGQWLLRDRRRALLTFGNNEAEARRALAVFNRYRFDRVSFVGDPTPSFMYFLGSNGDLQTKFAAQQSAETEGLTRGAAKPVHVVKGGVKPADPKRADIDPREKSTLLPPGRQLIQVTSIPGQANVPDRMPFNWQRAQVRQLGDSWELAAQDVTITRFGLDEAGAREALGILRHYHFTDMCVVGGDDPCFSYLLVNGRLPRELRFGIPNIAFHPERVQVSCVKGEFVVEADSVCIHNFGPREAAARSLCEFVRQCNPDHLCWIGADPEHSMKFFVRSTLAPFNSGNDAPRKP
jgi:hypothetical protein